MANLVPFDPFSDLMRFDPFGDMEEFFKDFRVAPLRTQVEMEPRIKMDLSENDQAYTVKAEIPGVKKEDIKVSIDGSQVSITAEMKKEKEEKKGETTIRSERYYGKQSRRFTVACDIDETKAEAKYEDGVLQLTLPKKPGTAGRELTVQ